jgi:aspartate/methionine/tyrosine aminotransferase
MRAPPPFRYMRWAKELRAGARYHLGASGLPPPPPELLPLGALDTDLAQHGGDAPPAAREALAARLGVTPERLAITLGTSHALYLACAVLLAPGDRCLVEEPAYEVLATLPTLFGAQVARFARRLDKGYRPGIDLAARIRSERPRLVVLSNPHNPSGALLSLDELEPLAAATREVGAQLIVDEVYLEYLADAPARSARHLGDHVVACASFTKAFGLGSVRFGWLVASQAIVEAALAFNDYIAVLYPNPCAWVGIAALERIDALQRRALAIREANLPIVRQFVRARAELSWHEPEAGIIAFLRIEGLADTGPFCERLLREQDTLLVPGGFFDAPAHVRLGFGIDQAPLREGLRRIGRALDARSAGDDPEL